MAILDSAVQPSDHLRIQSHSRETSNKNIKRKSKSKEASRTSQLPLWYALSAMQYFLRWFTQKNAVIATFHHKADPQIFGT